MEETGSQLAPAQVPVSTPCERRSAEPRGRSGTSPRRARSVSCTPTDGLCRENPCIVRTEFKSARTLRCSYRSCDTSVWARAAEVRRALTLDRRHESERWPKVPVVVRLVCLGAGPFRPGAKLWGAALSPGASWQLCRPSQVRDTKLRSSLAVDLCAPPPTLVRRSCPLPSAGDEPTRSVAQAGLAAEIRIG